MMELRTPEEHADHLESAWKRGDLTLQQARHYLAQVGKCWIEITSRQSYSSMWGLLLEERNGHRAWRLLAKWQEPTVTECALCALADLEGIMPQIEPSGERKHPGWQTIEDLRQALGLDKTKAQDKPMRAVTVQRTDFRTHTFHFTDDVDEDGVQDSIDNFDWSDTEYDHSDDIVIQDKPIT